MEVAGAHAVITQRACPFRDGFVDCREEAGIPKGAEILRGIEAEGSRLTQRADRLVAPAGPKGLRCVFDHLEPMRGSQGSEPVHIGGLTVQVNRQEGADRHSPRRCGFQRRRCSVGGQIEGSGVDVRQDRDGTHPQDGAHRRKEAERGREDGIPGTDTQGCQPEPQRIRAAGTTDSGGGAARRGCRKLKTGGGGTQHKLLPVTHGGDGLQNLLADLDVLAAEVEHGNGRGCSGDGARHALRIARSAQHPRLTPRLCRSNKACRVVSARRSLHRARMLPSISPSGARHTWKKGDRPYGHQAGAEYPGHVSQHRPQG